MTEISFYILAESAATTAERFCCRLAEDNRASRRHVYVHAVDDAQARRLDELMWTFRQNSFVPHLAAANRASDDRRTPILIGAEEPPTDFNDVLINLGGDVSPFFSRFTSQSEIVADERRNEARAAYRFYRDRGYQLQTHHVSADNG
ncbi:DNA polymerase III subunit chi [Salinisphaera sp. USBA-960]|uniref:DNA polymerase III subunit chi n=1 Tax=Salinisphaera orenii TaxID=856731 RepID=UPI000DBE8F97|nr:DNA polymerase III subunit chi [Salifodinibacter halophilus]NNC25478.1 DNA polymerase III subunit chi [Salifodinibacter halophilus]